MYVSIHVSLYLSWCMHCLSLYVHQRMMCVPFSHFLTDPGVRLASRKPKWSFCLYLLLSSMELWIQAREHLDTPNFLYGCRFLNEGPLTCIARTPKQWLISPPRYVKHSQSMMSDIFRVDVLLTACNYFIYTQWKDIESGMWIPNLSSGDGDWTCWSWQCARC